MNLKLGEAQRILVQFLSQLPDEIADRKCAFSYPSLKTKKINQQVYGGVFLWLPEIIMSCPKKHGQVQHLNQKRSLTKVKEQRINNVVIRYGGRERRERETGEQSHTQHRLFSADALNPQIQKKGNS